MADSQSSTDSRDANAEHPQVASRHAPDQCTSLTSSPPLFGSEYRGISSHPADVERLQNSKKSDGSGSSESGMNPESQNINSSPSREVCPSSVQSGSGSVLSVYYLQDDSLADPFLPQHKNSSQPFPKSTVNGDGGTISKTQSIQNLPSVQEDHVEQSGTHMSDYKIRRRKYDEDSPHLSLEELEGSAHKIQRTSPQDMCFNQPSKSESMNIFGKKFISTEDSDMSDLESESICSSDSSSEYETLNEPFKRQPVACQQNRIHDLLFVYGRVRRPEYAELPDRLGTFSGWPLDIAQTPDQVARAGFYYTGSEDIVRCFVCDGGLKNWDPDDDPWIEHARWFPCCRYIRYEKGEAFIQLVKIRTAESDEEDDSWEYTGATLGGTESCNTKVNSASNQISASSILETNDAQLVLEMGYSKRDVAMAINDIFKEGKDSFTCQDIVDIILEKETRKELVCSKVSTDYSPSVDNSSVTETAICEKKHSKELLQCTECKIKQRNILFLPCTHHLVCESCSRDLHICTYCYRKINEKVKTYMS